MAWEPRSRMTVLYMSLSHRCCWIPRIMTPLGSSRKAPTSMSDLPSPASPHPLGLLLSPASEEPPSSAVSKQIWHTKIQKWFQHKGKGKGGQHNIFPLPLLAHKPVFFWYWDTMLKTRTVGARFKRGGSLSELPAKKRTHVSLWIPHTPQASTQDTKKESGTKLLLLIEEGPQFIPRL